MVEKFENSPIQDERLQAVAGWIQENYRPVLRVISEGEQPDEQRQEFEVREYQLEAWSSVWEARQEGKTRGLVHLATGLGKTSVAVFDVMKFREEVMAEDPPVLPRVLFVSHMNDISDQARERFERFMPELESTSFRTRQKNIPEADITFATFQSLHSELHRFDPQDFEYIIYDEAHHSEAETFKEVRDYFDPLFELALTATPDRMDEKDIRDYFGTPLYSKGLPEAVAGGWLADVDYHIVFDDVVKEAMEQGFEPKTLKEFRELFKIRPRNEIIAENVREERHRIGLDTAKTIVFCEDVAHAEEMAGFLEGQAYHSGLDKEVRSSLLHDFRSGATQVICTVDMFNEGIDIPDARLLVFLRSTQSGTVFEQQLGRGLRRSPGKDRVSVLDFVANIERVDILNKMSVRIRQATEETIGAESLDGRPKTEGGSERYVVHAAHSDFDFDRIAVDLLEKFQTLKEGSRSRYSEYEDDGIVGLALRLQPDTPLTQLQIQQLSKAGEFPSLSMIVRRFGGVLEFQRACGFEVRLAEINLKNASDDEIIELAKGYSNDNVLSLNRMNKLSQEGKFLSPPTIKKRFGSMDNFRRACGFEVQEVAERTLETKDMSDEEIVALAKSIQTTPLKSEDIARLSKQGAFVGYSTIFARFGSLREFHKACGFEKIDFASMSNEEIVQRARSLKDGPLAYKEIRELSKRGEFISLTSMLKRFGSIVEFRKACGFDVD